MVPLSRKIFIGISIVIMIAMLILLYRINPEESLVAPKCLFYTLTGWKCPGCGSQRAIHALLHLRFGEALNFNPLLAFSIPMIALLFYLEYFGGRTRFPKVYELVTSRKWIGAILVIVVAYWVGRNL